MALTIQYELTGVGWCRCALEANAQAAELTASYVGDALGDLCRGVLAICDGVALVRFSWSEEPGEFRWILSRGADNVLMRVLWFDDDFGPAPDAQGESIFWVMLPVYDLTTTVLAMLDSILDRYGVDGYRQTWAGHEFPGREYERLKSIPG